jgi:hypothetical protein
MNTRGVRDGEGERAATKLPARLVEQQAADGSPLFDVVVDAADGSERAIYRGVDREHVDSVRADVEAGRLDPLDVQQVVREVILARSGRPQPVFIRGVPIPRSGRSGTVADRWNEARRRIEALRAKVR